MRELLKYFFQFLTISIVAVPGMESVMIANDYYLTITTGIQFSFIPSPPITILQSAVYQCILTDVDQSDAVSIQWSVNDISSSSPSWQSYITSNGITAVGTGTHNTILTIPGGNTTLNRTTVTSLASGVLSNGSSYVNSDDYTLYIQGMIVSTCTLNISQ